MADPYDRRRFAAATLRDVTEEFAASKRISVRSETRERKLGSPDATRRSSHDRDDPPKVMRSFGLLALALVAMLLNFVLAPLFVVLPVLVKQGRGLPPWYLGALQSSMG